MNCDCFCTWLPDYDRNIVVHAYLSVPETVCDWVVAHYINICLCFGQFYTWRPVYEGGIVEHDYLCMIWTLLYVTTFLWLGDCFIWLPCTVLYITIYLWLGLFCTWLSVYDGDYFVHDYLSIVGQFCTWLPVYDGDYFYMTTVYIWSSFVHNFVYDFDCFWLPVYRRGRFVHDYLCMIGTICTWQLSISGTVLYITICLWLEQFFITWLHLCLEKVNDRNSLYCNFS